MYEREVCLLLLASLAVNSIYTCSCQCYDMEVGENRVRVFYGTEKRGEKLEIYTEGISPCRRAVYQTCNMSPVQVHL
jgi:hypothetical protein